mgnify:CR=1 FL=1
MIIFDKYVIFDEILLLNNVKMICQKRHYEKF